MDSDNGPYSPRLERPVVTAVLLPGVAGLDPATIEDSVAVLAFDADVRVLLFARMDEALGIEGRDGTIVLRVPDELVNDERALRRKAVAETSGDVYRFFPSGRGAGGWMPPDLAGRLRQAGVPHPAEPGVEVGR